MKKILYEFSFNVEIDFVMRLLLCLVVESNRDLSLLDIGKELFVLRGKYPQIGQEFILKTDKRKMILV